ncbi:hypothetical protein [Streptomyces celluloflavus]|uniref:hypothetical protein n=1 Tax=Streptomyces celluloflavus TaxID=58344 RepID=UPI0036C4C68E
MQINENVTVGTLPAKPRRGAARKRTLASSLATLALASAAALGISPGVAYAGDATIYTGDSGPGGKLIFQANGDNAWVCDIKADSNIVYGWASYTAANGKKEYALMHDADGANGNCAQLPTSDMKEGSNVLLEVCLRANLDSPTKYCNTRTATA